MSFRFGSAVLSAALAVVLTACPTPSPTDGGDPGFDAGNPLPVDGCSGGCAENQVCDTAKRICVDACGGCDAGQCRKVGPNQFSCITPVVTCNGSVCEPGQVACLGGGCACLANSQGGADTCAEQGKWCTGGVCLNPKRYEQCKPGALSCPALHVCAPVFGEDLPVCIKSCTDSNMCDRGEACWGYSQTEGGCLPLGLFRGQECNHYIVAADGGFELVQDADGGWAPARLTVPVSNTCLLKDGDGTVTDDFVGTRGRGTGNCTYSMFKFWDEGNYPFRTCRPPGQATLGQACRADYTAGTVATQCATGLECALTRGGDQGVCLKACNANPAKPGFTPLPGCATDESCVNLNRLTDPNDNAVLGVCMKKCDVFDAAKATCADAGAATTSCVPSTPDGQLVLSLDGAGICVPQQATIAQLGAACAETDAFHGAACGNAQLCIAGQAGAASTCIGVCDLACVARDGGAVPARCATQPNATCTGGKTCQRVTTTTGARAGFCL